MLKETEATNYFYHLWHFERRPGPPGYVYNFPYLIFYVYCRVKTGMVGVDRYLKWCNKCLGILTMLLSEPDLNRVGPWALGRFSQHILAKYR